ncbi:BON domain protein [compost metagenome]
MKSDAQLKKDVEAELEWDPSINAAEVGVAVKDGVVTLSGHLDTFVEKYEVEKVVQRVAGVRAVAVEIEVKLTTDSTVVLRGSVHSLAERVAAQGAAWSAPGITRVDNELRISP